MPEPSRPWHSLYPRHVSPNLMLADQTLAEAWDRRVRTAPDEPAISCFGAKLSSTEADAMADALGVELQHRGVGPGDRVGIQLQNVPHFALALLALWKIGGVPLVLNPMYRDRELRAIVSDAAPVGLIGAADQVDDSLTAWGKRRPVWTLSVDDSHGQALGRPMTAPDSSRSTSTREDDVVKLMEARRGQRPEPVPLSRESPALLTYTSGTTGPPKGAVGSHKNLLAVAEGDQRWLDVRRGDRVLAVAPLFHITGAVATATMTLVSGAELVFINRPRPEIMLETIRDREVHHVLGSITVYNALLDAEEGRMEDLVSLRTVYSGGAPVPPATVERFRRRYGHYIHNIYGMTETASAVIAVPLGTEAPVDPASGTLAIGVPLPGMDARITGLDGAVLPTGSFGELELRGPQCTPGYLGNEEATAETFHDGWLRTGDVAFTDEHGWFYLVDRMKDQINVSGYKVWPREVEDVLYEHTSVREAAVVGSPDSYSGERVVAYVSLQQGAQAQGEELREHVRTRIASYKCPREVTVLDDLPKTATGKIQRRKLRDGAGHEQRDHIDTAARG